MGKVKVLFTKEITPESLVKIYEKLGVELKGNVAIKLHSGEKGNQNYLRPDFMKPLVDKLNATVVECNTAYPGERTSNTKHRRLLNDHGWDKYYNVDIMDENGSMILYIPNGNVIKKNYVGKNIKNYAKVIASNTKNTEDNIFQGCVKTQPQKLLDAAVFKS